VVQIEGREQDPAGLVPHRLRGQMGENEPGMIDPIRRTTSMAVVGSFTAGERRRPPEG
jgi:hypothetical protein